VGDARASQDRSHRLPLAIRRHRSQRGVSFVTPAEVEGCPGERSTPFPSISKTFWSHRGELCNLRCRWSKEVRPGDAALRAPTMCDQPIPGGLICRPRAPGAGASLRLSRMYDDDSNSSEAGMTLSSPF